MHSYFWVEPLVFWVFGMLTYALFIEPAFKKLIKKFLGKLK